jgi:hypothetical protein
MAAGFSSSRSMLLVPGIGTTSSRWAGSQASATCAAVASHSRATRRSWATSVRLRAPPTPVQRGSLRRRSSPMRPAVSTALIAESDGMNRTGFSPVPREKRGKPPRTGGSFPRRVGSAHGVTHGARIRPRTHGRPSHMLRRRREGRRHQRRFGASRCGRSSCRCRCSRDRGVCSGPSPRRRVRPGPRLHSSCSYQRSPSIR